MKRLILTTLGLVAAALLLLSPTTAFALTPNDAVDCEEAPTSTFCVERQKTDNPIFGPRGILTRGGLILSFLTGAISVFMMVWGGLKFVMSSGDAQKISTAKNTILYASIALAVSISAAAIVQFILKRL